MSLDYPSSDHRATLPREGHKTPRAGAGEKSDAFRPSVSPRFRRAPAPGSVYRRGCTVDTYIHGAGGVHAGAEEEGAATPIPSRDPTPVSTVLGGRWSTMVGRKESKMTTKKALQSLLQHLLLLLLHSPNATIPGLPPAKKGSKGNK